MITQGTDIRHVRRGTFITNDNLVQLWDQYSSHDLSAEQLLNKCADIYFHDFKDLCKSFVTPTVANPAPTEEERALFAALFE